MSGSGREAWGKKRVIRIRIHRMHLGVLTARICRRLVIHPVSGAAVPSSVYARDFRCALRYGFDARSADYVAGFRVALAVLP